MKISVVSVVRNARDKIRNTIESVLSQTYTNIEYIIIDGLSSDGTIELLQSYENKLSRLIIDKDNGLYDAMNKGLEIATGDFLIFMNSGDTFYSSDTIEKVVNMISDSASVVYGNVLQVHSETGKQTFFGGKFDKYRLCFKNICHQSIFYPLAIYKSYKYDLKYKIFADYFYNISLVADNVSFIHINQIISYFELGGLSDRGDERMTKDKSKIILNKFGVYYYLYYLVKKNIRIRKLLKTLCK